MWTRATINPIATGCVPSLWRRRRLHVCPFAVQPASLVVKDLAAHGPVANASILKATCSSRDSWTDSELWRKTSDKMKQGWLAPISCEEAVSTGRLSRRFAVVQSSKVRCIDNYSESQVNDAVTVMSRSPLTELTPSSR